MSKFIILLVFNLFVQYSFSQTENAKQTLRIKAKELEKEDQNASRLLNLSTVKGLTDKGFKISMGIPPIDGFAKKERSITTHRDVVDPTWEINQSFSENKKDVSKYSKDYYLGDIKTKSKFIRIICRDHEYEDGDRIKLILNKVTIHPNIRLSNSGYVLDIKLNEGLNTIEFYALNEGTSSPNTAELKVLDENSSIIVSGQWLLTTGFRAKLMVLKQ